MRWVRPSKSSRWWCQFQCSCTPPRTIMPARHIYDSGWDDDALASARQYVDAVGARLGRLGLSADAEVRMARGVAEAIVESAEQAEVDLIVMSTQALTGPARTLLGSVADAVVRTSHCPVLLIHRAETHEGLTNSPELKRGI